MRKLITILFLFVSISSQAQNTDEIVKWLNNNTSPTVRDFGVTYTKYFNFKPEGIEWNIGADLKGIVYWSELIYVSKVSSNRVYISYYGKDREPIFEYLTPSSGITNKEVIDKISDLYYAMYEKVLKVMPGELKDQDQTYREEAVQKEANRKSQLYQDAAPGMLIAEMLNGTWEFTISSSFKQDKRAILSSTYEPVETYYFLDARFRVVYGSKHIRFSFSPAGFTWVTLPSYKKYTSSGSLIKYDDLGDTRFYSPSVGLSYVFFPKKELNNKKRSFEVPLAVNYAAMWSPANKIITEDLTTADSPFKEYFKTNRSIIQGTVGFDIWGKSVGFGLHAGVRYISIEGTDALLTETVSGNQRKFTLKFDELNRTVPFGEIKFLIRFQ